MAYHFIYLQMIHNHISRLRPTALIMHPTRRRQLRCVLKILAIGCCNKLKLNQNLTELLVVSLRCRPRPPLNRIQVGGDVISPCEHARNLGNGFDKYFDFSEHVKMTCTMVFQSIWLIDFNLCRIQQLALLLRQESMIILHRFLGVYTGSLCAIELF